MGRCVSICVPSSILFFLGSGIIYGNRIGDRVTDPGDLLTFLDQVHATLIEGSTVQVVVTQCEHSSLGAVTLEKT